MKILVSSCLLGCNCRYDGKSQNQNEITNFFSEHSLIPFCPEQAGGMPTPRTPCELVDGRILDNTNEDFTDIFLHGAKETLKMCKLLDIQYAILKSKSPSCGFGLIYDGSFSSTLIDGNGLTAELLASNNIKIYNENNYLELLKYL